MVNVAYVLEDSDAEPPEFNKGAGKRRIVHRLGAREHRFGIWLTDKEYRALQSLAQFNKVSVSAAIVDAIQRYIQIP